jgi:hypothetical protein
MNSNKPQNQQLNIDAVSRSKKIRVRCSLFNENWNGGEFKQIEEYIIAKNKTSAIEKFINNNRTKLNSFDYFNIEAKNEVL